MSMVQVRLWAQRKVGMDDWIDRLAAVECPAFTARRARQGDQAGSPKDPLVWTRAHDEFVWDSNANRYIDMTAGFGVMNLGHSHASVRAAVDKQLGSLWHALGDVHPSDKKIELMEALCELSPFDDARAVLGLSGSDAIDAALKTAQLVTKRPGVIAFDGGYHGLASGPLATNGYRAAMREPFSATLNPHVVFLPYSTTAEQLDQLRSELKTLNTAEIGAMLIEPVQGRGGIHVPAENMLQTLRAYCDKRGILLIADEVLTGLGRTGSVWASVAAGLKPDLLCIGKALGGGLPISACIGPLELMKAWGSPTSEALHTGTFFGNPLSCAAALGFLNAWKHADAPHLARERGERLREVFLAMGRGTVRGKGMMLALDLQQPGAGLLLVHKLRDRGVIVLPNGANASGIQLTPPLNLPLASIASFKEALIASLRELGAVPRLSRRPPASSQRPSSSEDERTRLQEQIRALITRLAHGDTDEPARDALIDKVCAWQQKKIPTLYAWRDIMQGDALPTAAFHHARIAAFSKEDEVGSFRTSGTTASERGVHPYRDLSLYDLAARSAAKFALFPDCESIDLLILAPRHADVPTSSLFYMLTRFSEWFGDKTTWFVQGDKIDTQGFVDALHAAQDRGRPVALLGTSLAFLKLEPLLDECFTLPAGSRLMHTGGFKGKKVEVEASDLRARLAKRYGIDPPFVVREYGMTEMSSQLYEWSLRDALERKPIRETYWIPGWVRVSEVSLSALLGAASTSQRSALRIDDLANLDTCVALQTFDSGTVSGTSLRLDGRLTAAPVRGCSLTAEQWDARSSLRKWSA